LCKLFNGSYGTLGLITELTFKLRPRPAREATIIVRAPDVEALIEGARRLRAGQFLPVALELLAPALATTIGVPAEANEFALLVRFAGNDASVADQAERALMLFSSERMSVLAQIEPDAQLWRLLAAQPLTTDRQLIWRASVRPSNVSVLLAALRREQPEHFESHVWHACLGDGRLRVMQDVEPDAACAAEMLARLRRITRELGGALIIERAPAALQTAFDAWGASDANARLMHSIKQQLDPNGLLAPGRFH